MEQSVVTCIIPLIAGYLLDLLLGDPRWLPHPIRLFGNIIFTSEKTLNNNNYRFLKGMLLTIILCLITYYFFYVSELFFYTINVNIGLIYTSIFIFYGLANKSLLQEGRAVFDALDKKGLEAGRKRLSWIVGRDTSQLEANKIKIAVFETLSENLSDGVIAPLFYYAIGGIPAMMTYKLINTLDSMIGYKSERYFYFGKFAARLDDVANYIPARLTAMLIAIAGRSSLSLKFIFKYGNKHSSPNSGFPEAALAGVLNCRFGGANVYHNQLIEKPYIGYNERSILHQELNKVIIINHCVTLFMVLAITILKLAWH